MYKHKYIWGICLSLAVFLSSTLTSHAEEHIVHVISDYDEMRMTFEPKNLQIKKGDTVTWVNDVEEDHNMLTYPDGYPLGSKGFSSPYLEKAGDKWSYTFDDEGIFEYHCLPHIMMGMRGRILVGNIANNLAMNIPSYEESKSYRDAMLEFFDEDDFDHMPEYVSAHLHMGCNAECKANMGNDEEW